MNFQPSLSSKLSTPVISTLFFDSFKKLHHSIFSADEPAPEFPSPSLSYQESAFTCIE
jgi:hypothetical protein